MSLRLMRLWVAVTGIGLGIILLGLLLVNTPAGVDASAYLHGTPNPSGTPHHDTDDVDALLSNDVPTYFADVEPIIVANCLGCHSAGNIGYGTYSIDSYADILENAEDIAYFVDIGYMPPWMPSEDSPEFMHERGLVDEDINTVVAWFEGGAILGDVAARTITNLVEAPVTNLATIDVDLELTMPTAYTPNADLTDDYRCFLIDPEFTEDTYVTGYNVAPDNKETVHHVIIYQAPSSARVEAEIKERADGRPGWECFGGTNLDGRQGGPMIGGWVPGSVPIEYTAGTGILVPAGNLLVVQMHYNLISNWDADQSTIQLQLDEVSDEIEPLRVLPMLAPVELLCPLGIDSEACSRNEAMFDAANFRSNFLLDQCGKTAEDYADQPVANIVSECDFTIPINGTLMGTLPHMHELGKSTKLELNPDTADAQLLIEIPEWDFHWQGSYQYINPIRVEPGDVLRVTCVWDNSENDKYVVWGERTQDEMCINFVTYLAD